MRENRPLKVKVCAILTFITLGILFMFLVVLPSLFISDAISYVSSGSSLFFPHVPDTHFLWFLPQNFQGLPLSLGQFLDMCVFSLIILQSSSMIYIILARFYRYQPSSADIPFEVKKKFGDTLPNFMRWNILPHGHQLFGQDPEDGKIDRKFTVNYREFQRTSFNAHICLAVEGNDGLHHPLSNLAGSKNRLLNSGYLLGSIYHLSLDCNILVSHSDRFVSAPSGCYARYSPSILASSCFSRVCNSSQILEVLA